MQPMKHELVGVDELEALRLELVELGGDAPKIRLNLD
jgi:hypothetical protein